MTKKVHQVRWILVAFNLKSFDRSELYLSLFVLQVTETASSLGMSEEEFKQHSRMKRLEAEAQEEVCRENIRKKNLNSFPGATDARRPARGQDEEAAPTRASSA